MLLGKFNLPMRVDVGKNKTFTLNLNQYRNAHYFILNKAKQTFQDEVTKTLSLEPTDKIEIHYKVFPKTKALSDISNYCSIVDKFFSDTLVHCGIIPDDNYNHLPKVVYEFGGIDPINPRVEALIYKIES